MMNNPNVETTDSKRTNIEPLYLEDFAGMTKQQVHDKIDQEFEPSEKLKKKFKRAQVLIAYMSVSDYGCDSSAWLLLKLGKKLYEVSGSHCSCYGFETQFEPEETTVEYLKSDKFSFSRGGYDRSTDIQTVRDWIKVNL